MNLRAVGKYELRYLWIFSREREGGGQGSSLSYNTINLINTYLK